MPEVNALASPDPQADEGRITKLAVLAVGGQGGGVLADWITDVAERSGYLAQSTSVAGVAQRTGATIYYVEMCRDLGRQPVFALSPSPGDVDILIAAELMEAGRAIMRGFVTADRTTLIASSHRIAAVSEKIEPGDGRAPSAKVLATAENAAKRFIAFDMEKIAAENGSMISASLLGALAGSGALPFPRENYEKTILASGRGMKASLAAFVGGYERAGGERTVAPENASAKAALPLIALPGTSPRKDGEKNAASAISPNSAAEMKEAASDTALFSPSLRGEDAGRQMRGGSSLSESLPTGPDHLLNRWQKLQARVAAYPEPVRDMAGRGLQKVVDYQDLAYGAEYLNRLDQAVGLERAGRGHALSIAAAKHLANAMCYDDMIRVADLKTRSTRDRRVRREVGVAEGSVLQVTEYFHPRVEEFCGALPAGLGRYIESRPSLAAFIDRRINRGRRIRTDGMLGFSALWLVGGLRRWRRKLLRHQVESAHLERWYRLALDHAASDYALAVEILNCRRLIKGYSDTHARAQSKFDRVLSGLPLLAGRPDAADWLRRLREAALKDEKGDMLDGALKTVASLDASVPTLH
jgi:indolepyruvate ferredoxin oxidoreductase beta subunit